MKVWLYYLVALVCATMCLTVIVQVLVCLCTEPHAAAWVHLSTYLYLDPCILPNEAVIAHPSC